VLAWAVCLGVTIAGATLGARQGALRDLAATCGILIGTAVDHDALVGEPIYADTLRREFSGVTPENVMKWDAIHPTRSRYDFRRADALMAFAASNNLLVHGTTLVWHQQNPDWLANGRFTRDEMIGLLREHVDSVVGRYRGRQLASWDVVNEAFEGDGTLRHTLWLERIGPDYLDLAFRFAHAADPTARLFLNDYDAEMIGAKSDAMYAFVAGMLARGVPIHGIGFQMHLHLGGIDLGSFAANMQRFADLGLEVAITEMDVRIELPATPETLVTQAGVYNGVLNSCLGQPACRAFRTWGFTDRHSWIPEWFPGTGAALIFDEAFQPKPAYAGLSQRLGQCAVPPPPAGEPPAAPAPAEPTAVSGAPAERPDAAGTSATDSSGVGRP
jgi:endo-1,4-beta-xylanase